MQLVCYSLLQKQVAKYKKLWSENKISVARKYHFSSSCDPVRFLHTFYKFLGPQGLASQEREILIFIEDIPLCLIIYRVNKLFVVAVI